MKIGTKKLLILFAANHRLLHSPRRLLPTNCLSVFDHFVGLALKGLRSALLCIRESQIHRSLHLLYLVLLTVHVFKFV